MKKKNFTKDFINHDYIDQNGNAVVDVIINDTSKLFSPYSDKKLLNREIFLYLDTIADPIPNIYPLIINFVISEIDTIDQEYVRNALKRYYWFSYQEMMKNLKKELLFIGLYIFLGLSFLIVPAHFLTDSQNRILIAFSSLTVIISWMFLWEAVSQLIIGRRIKIIDKNNERQMALAEVRFISQVGEIE